MLEVDTQNRSFIFIWPLEREICKLRSLFVATFWEVYLAILWKWFFIFENRLYDEFACSFKQGWIIHQTKKVNIYFFFKKKKTFTLLNFMAPLYGWGSTAARLQPLRGGSLLFTTKFPEIPGTHFIDRGRMKGLVDLGALKWFWIRDPWIGNPALYLDSSFFWRMIFVNSYYSFHICIYVYVLLNIYLLIDDTVAS